MAWYEQKPQGSKIAVSTRVRLARNITSYPFPNKMDSETAKRLLMDCRNAFEQTEWLKNDFIWMSLSATPQLEREKLYEKHLMSADMLKNPENKVLILHKDKEISIMINEEDHVRIQTIKAGLDLEGAMKLADQVDCALSEKLEFCFSPKFGYLTSCPTNTGTGLRASVMLHLPFLTEGRHIDNLIAGVSRAGLAVRGWRGEGSKAQGFMYQVSNQVTLGWSEEITIKHLNEIIKDIITKESHLRKTAIDSQRLKLENKIWRSFGIMKYSKMLTEDELLRIESDLRLGSDMNILSISEDQLNKLMVESSPAHLISLFGCETEDERCVRRAEIAAKIQV